MIADRSLLVQAPLSFTHWVSSDWVPAWTHANFPSPSGHLYYKKAEDKDSARMDSLAICSGEDKRLVVVPSFASVGIKHTWLLLKARSQLFEWQGLKEGFLQNLFVCSCSTLDRFYRKLPILDVSSWKSDTNTDIFCQQDTVETKNQISHWNSINRTSHKTGPLRLLRPHRPPRWWTPLAAPPLICAP